MVLVKQMVDQLSPEELKQLRKDIANSPGYYSTDSGGQFVITREVMRWRKDILIELGMIPYIEFR